MLAFPDWDVKTGDFHCVEIYKDEKKIYEMKRMQGWNELPVGINPRKREIEYCCPRNVVDDTVVLLFSGTELLDQLTPMSIVVLKGEQAKLVFNQPCFIGSANIGSELKTDGLGRDKTIEFTYLNLFFKKPKYDDKGKLVQRPVQRKLYIAEKGIWFEAEKADVKRL